MSCVFCDIAKGELNCDKIYEDEDVLAFKDLEPQAPVHFLVIPKKHIKNMFEVKDDEKNLIGKIFIVIREIAKDLDLKDGFRVVNNCNKEAGQTVMHLHFHVLGKRALSWPPG